MNINLKNKISNYMYHNPLVIHLVNFNKNFFRYYLMNTFIASFPSHKFRNFYYRYWGMKIGTNTYINRNLTITFPHKVEIGSNTRIGWNCHFQGQGGIKIGNNVNFAS